MNSIRLTSPREFPLAIEDHDVEFCRSAGQHLRRDAPGALRHFIAELNPLARARREGFGRGVGADDAARQRIRSTARPRHFSQRPELDAPAREDI